MTSQTESASHDQLRMISTLIDQAASLADSNGEMKPEAIGQAGAIRRHKLAQLCEMVRTIGVSNILAGLGILDEKLESSLQAALKHVEDVEEAHKGRGGISTTSVMFRREMFDILKHFEILKFIQPEVPEKFDPRSDLGHPRDLFSKAQVMDLIALDRTAARLQVLTALSDTRIMEAFLGLID